MILWQREQHTTSYFLTTESASTLPGKKRTRFFAGTCMGLRSRGFTPLRAALLRTLKEPKPTKRTSFPAFRESRMLSSVASNTSPAFFCVNPACAAIRFVSSCRPTIVVVDFVDFVVAMGLKSSLQRTTHVAFHPVILLLGL